MIAPRCEHIADPTNSPSLYAQKAIVVNMRSAQNSYRGHFERYGEWVLKKSRRFAGEI
jgi:hypothetical protein